MLRKPVRPIERAVSNLAGRDLVRSKVCASGARADRLDGFVRNVVAAGGGRGRFEGQTDLGMGSGGEKLPAGRKAGERAAGDGRSRFEAQTDLVMVSGGNNLPAGLSAVETGPGVLEDAHQSALASAGPRPRRRIVVSNRHVVHCTVSWLSERSTI